MRGAPQSAIAGLISPMSVRSSAETFGLPTRLRDRQRQYARNPARCQRMMVSGLTIATTSRTDGNQRKSQTNRKRSILLRCGRFGVRRRSTLTCCRRTRFSASSVALALKREARIPKISLNRSVIRIRAYAVRLLRLRRIEFSVHTALLSDAAAVGEAMAKASAFSKRFPGMRYRPDTHWELLIPPLMDFGQDVPDSTLFEERTAFFYEVMGASQAAATKTPGVGSAYLIANHKKDGGAFDDGRH